jgi:hypothetical protein
VNGAVDLVLLIGATLMAHAVYDLIKGPLAQGWRARRHRRQLAQRFEEFKRHLAGHGGVCPVCQTLLREHGAIQNGLGCFAVCPGRSAVALGVPVPASLVN